MNTDKSLTKSLNTANRIPPPILTDEKIILWPFDSEMIPKEIQKILREFDLPVFAALALSDSNYHAVAVNVHDSEIASLGDP
jgi:hypothetical protein